MPELYSCLLWHGACMRSPTTLTRAEFEQACKGYIASENSNLLEYAPIGWEWREHSVCRPLRTGCHESELEFMTGRL